MLGIHASPGSTAPDGVQFLYPEKLYRSCFVYGSSFSPPRIHVRAGSFFPRQARRDKHQHTIDLSGFDCCDGRMESPAANETLSVTPLSVTQLTAGIKKLLEQNYASIEVSGEVSRLTRHASGHIYFTIKDAHASISAVIWKSTALRLKLHPEEGKEFIFSGSISVYEPRGTYQLVVRKVEAVGAGQLAEEFERRKKRFAELGWFDQNRKQIPPELPGHIGIVSSPTSAAFEDVKKVLATRPAWLRLTLAPAVVQGDGAPQSIKKAIEELHAMDDRPDLILLVRGGGSMEDLWCFNDEQVVRAVVDTTIPIISGVGHEIDTTLVDFAADVRAATPSNAAELACPDRESLRSRITKPSQLNYLWQRSQDSRHQHSDRRAIQMTSAFRHQIAQNHRYINSLKQRLAEVEPRRQLRQRQQRLTRCQQHLHMFQQHGTDRNRLKINQLRQQLGWLSQRHIENRRNDATTLNRQLCDLGPKQVLKRGYTMSTDMNGHLISSAGQLQAGDAVHIHFHDGDAEAKTVSVSTGEKR